MAFFEKIKDTWEQFTQSEFAQKSGPVLKKTGTVLALTAKWAYKLRSVLLAIPVAVAALALAVRNMQQLPSVVGINMMSNGDFQWTLTRSAAAMIPLGITAICLVLMCLSKKVLYPWLISVFSLALPLIIWFINVFPT